MKEMKENEKNMRKKPSRTLHNQPEEDLLKMEHEDLEIYLFMRGGFAAK
ncbi:MAG: hypothetical protein OIN66_11610 [Candidatus Methanoperedens sp.]|nr:hypothetical protein [Candidatus Methanoperedens sp.]